MICVKLLWANVSLSKDISVLSESGTVNSLFSDKLSLFRWVILIKNQSIEHVNEMIEWCEY